MAEAEQTLLIKGGKVYDHTGDTDSPAAADVLIAGDTIAAVEPDLTARIEAGETHPALGGAPPGRVIHADDRLLVPGFVNAHYHSHDVLLKGCFETIHREAWLLNSLPPNYPQRSREELRARTLLGALECLRSGITTVQDMCTVYPFDEGDIDVILDAYDEIGIRCVFAPQIADVQGAALTPFWDEVVPAEYQSWLTGPAGGLEDIVGADHIVVEDLLPGSVASGQGGQMDHQVHAFKGGLDGLQVGDVRQVALHAGHFAAVQGAEFVAVL